MRHFGEKDEHIPVASVREIAAAYPDVVVYLYPAGQGFNCDRREGYDALRRCPKTIASFRETSARCCSSILDGMSLGSC